MNVVKSCSPCVFLLDESEKMLGSAVLSSNNVDGGITARIFQSILKFLQENEDVFVVVTANYISQLPPEFLRSGRLDTIWYFGLPSEEERKELLKIHFKKRNRNFSEIILNTAVKVSENFTGAEIEQLVKNSIRCAYIRSKTDNNKNILKEDIIKGSKEISPVYKTSREKILALETYCNGRAGRTSEILQKNNLQNSRENIFSNSLEF